MRLSGFGADWNRVTQSVWRFDQSDEPRLIYYDEVTVVMDDNLRILWALRKLVDEFLNGH
jgi:hypothetical protein